MKWIKAHIAVIAILLIFAGLAVLCVLVGNNMHPIVSVTDSGVIVYHADGTGLACGIIAIILVVVGIILTVKNEYRAYLDRKSFLDAMNIKRKK